MYLIIFVVSEVAVVSSLVESTENLEILQMSDVFVSNGRNCCG